MYFYFAESPTVPVAAPAVRGAEDGGFSVDSRRAVFLRLLRAFAKVKHNTRTHAKLSRPRSMLLFQTVFRIKNTRSACSRIRCALTVVWCRCFAVLAGCGCCKRAWMECGLAMCKQLDHDCECLLPNCSPQPTLSDIFMIKDSSTILSTHR